MKIVSLVLGVLLLIAGWGSCVLETGLSGDKSTIQTKIASHLSIVMGGLLLAIARLKKKN